MFASLKCPRYSAATSTMTFKDLFLYFEKTMFASQVQRKPGVWSRKDKSDFIIDCINKVYFGEITLSSRKNNYYIIDGLQRTSTISDFISNKFSLLVDENSSYYCLNGLKFRNLDENDQAYIYDLKIRALVFENMTIQDEAKQFNILNSGKPLCKPEKRFSTTDPKYREFVANIISSSVFNELFKEKFLTDKRFKRSELPARLIAIRDFISKKEHTLEEMYNEKFQTVNQSSINASSVIQTDSLIINNTLPLIQDLLGRDAFLVNGSVHLPCSDIIFSVLTTNTAVDVSKWLSPNEVRSIQCEVNNWKKTESELFETVNASRHSRMIESLMKRIGKYVKKLPVQPPPA